MPEPEQRPAGYEALVQRHALGVIPNWHRSAVSRSGPRIIRESELVEEVYPAAYWPGDSLGAHLEFALKYDGTNLAILASIFSVADPAEFTEFLRSRPTGKYARRLWFLYEALTGRRLPLDDLSRGNYVDLLDPAEYYTGGPAERSPRHRINNNLPGDARFCPLVRRTDALRAFEESDLPERARRLVAEYPPELLSRAMRYLYAKETRSSFEIEHVEPDSGRIDRFVAALQHAEREDYVRKDRLIELQRRIVDPRFAETEYRSVQNYVGETAGSGREIIHCAFPRPQDVRDLMEGVIESHRRLESGAVHPVVHAAAIAWGFVFIHPFEDGNGRIHRFLIHNILSRRGFTPQGLVFPVSAAMLKDMRSYDASLEQISRPLMELVEYSLDDSGRMSVHNDASVWYRYLDLTSQAEALFRFVERTIETELVPELSFLASYDRAKARLQEIVDMPDRKIDLFIKLCHEQGGRLSNRKRESHFEFLTDEEVAAMEDAMREAFQPERA